MSNNQFSLHTREAYSVATIFWKSSDQEQVIADLQTSSTCITGNMQGFMGGRDGISTLPRNLEIEYGYYCFVTGNNNLVSDCVRSNLRGSKFKIFLGKHDPLASRHGQLRVRERTFARYYHPAAILSPPPPPPPPNSKSCMICNFPFDTVYW